MPPRIRLPALRGSNASTGTRAVSYSPINARPRQNTAASNLLGLDASSQEPRPLRPSASSPPSLGANSLRDMLAASRDRAPSRSTGSGASSNPSQRLRDSAERLRRQKVSDEFMGFMPRPWLPGDVYAPHDLSPAEMRKWGKPKARAVDVVDMLGVNPKDYYKNFSVISEFVTSFGQIRHSNSTGLRPVNQRRVAKAVRRAIGLGLHPSVHRHPEILALQLQTYKSFVHP